MRLLPPIVICLALLPGCKTDPLGSDDDVGGEVIPELVPEDEFARQAAETLCAQLLACECGDLPFTTEVEPLTWTSEAQCVAEKQPEFQLILDNALMGGGSYSPECGGEYIADFLRPDCQSLWDFRVNGGHFTDSQVCPLVVHERQVGDECEPFASNVNDCGEGKLCTFENYTCVEIAALPVEKGGSCQVGWVDLPCAPGLVCGSDGEANVCQEPAKVGDPCPNYSCLGADLSCDYANTMTCQPAAGEGDSCESQACAAGLYCDGGQMFTCVAQYEFGHGCANDSVCAHGGVCSNNLCTPPAPAVCSL